MNHEKTKNAFYTMATIALSILFGIVFLRWLFPILLPFLISYTIACLATKPAISLADRLSAKRGKMRLFISLFALLVLLLVVFFVGKYTAVTLWQIASGLLEGDKLGGFIDSILSPFEAIFGDGIPPRLETELTDALKGIFSTLASRLAAFLGSAVGALPGVLLFLVATLISLCYFALDLEKINLKVKELLPQRWGSALSTIRERLLSVGVRYVASYFILMGITFTVVLFGFLILRVSHAALLALLIAIFDLFPVIGVGTAIIPWAIAELILGNTARGIGLLVLFVINELIRQFAEPKIVGKSLNMHPLITLILIYVTISLFGFKGILLIPIVVAIFSLFGLQDKENE